MKIINERTVQIAQNVKEMGIGSRTINEMTAVEVFEGPTISITPEMDQEAKDLYNKITAETDCLVFPSDCLIAVAVQASYKC